MTIGEIGDGQDLLVRVHSECLTGDALGSLRCDCGIQLRLSLRMIAAEGRGVFIYATGHEGRGIGLVNKLRAYAAQDHGADTVDANTLLGLPVDSRDYTDTAAVLAELGVRTVRLLTNNPTKAAGLRKAGLTIDRIIPLQTAPHHRNNSYLTTKAHRLGHVRPTGDPLPPPPSTRVDATALLGEVRPRPDRPYVVLKYAQTLDGRIATSTGDARWISGEEERTVSHALRAACDGVMVGIGTVVQDDPQLTVRMVAGASPIRIVLDSTLRVAPSAKVLDADASTIVLTTALSEPERRDELRRRGARVEVVAGRDGHVDLRCALAALRHMGVESVLVEGGSRVITSLLAGHLVDRMIVSLSPIVIGTGTQAVNSLGITQVADGIRLAHRTVVPVGDDLLLAGDVVGDDLAGPAAGEPFVELVGDDAVVADSGRRR
jgi:3,4-dihydroxy 2-butanone 4-phosphate synthase/GTP cyclohydrolase II